MITGKYIKSLIESSWSAIEVDQKTKAREENNLIQDVEYLLKPVILKRLFHKRIAFHQQNIIKIINLCSAGSLGTKKRSPYKTAPMTLEWAAKHGYYLVFLHLYEKCKIPYVNDGKFHNTFYNAVEKGNLDIIRYLIEVIRAPCPNYAISVAGCANHLHVVKYLHMVAKAQCEPRDIDWVSGRGHCEIVQYIYEIIKPVAKDPEYNISNALQHAAESGSVKLVKYLHETCGLSVEKDDVYTMYVAAKNGHLDVLKYLHEILHAPCDNDAIDIAARNGHYDVVVYLFTVVKAFCTEGAIYDAARYGHFKIIVYLVEVVKVPKPSNILVYNGHLKILKYLHKVAKIPIDPDVMVSAAKDGHFSTVKYLHKNGVLCTEMAFLFAAENGHIKILRYFHKVMRFKYNNTIAVTWASSNGHSKTVKYLVKVLKIKPSYRAVDNAASNGWLHIVRYLVESHKCQYSSAGLSWAKMSNHPDIVAYLTTHTCALLSIPASFEIK